MEQGLNRIVKHLFAVAGRARQSAVFLGVVLCVLSGSSAAADAEQHVIRYPHFGSNINQPPSYFVEMLTLALEKTRESDGDFLLEPVSLRVPQGRMLRMLSAGEKVDVVWTMTSRERERYLRPVRIPLTKGLIGYRLLVVREADAERFSEIHNLEQLAEYTAGQGADWPDTGILRHNDLPVTTDRYSALFVMLHRERIDYMPRAMSEPWSEIARRPDLDLVVAPEVLLYYPTASYFFVQRSNTALAERLERGMEKAIADGSFDRLFLHHPNHEMMFKRSAAHQRRILHLENPLLPEEMPFDREELWWHPDESAPENTTGGQ